MTRVPAHVAAASVVATTALLFLSSVTAAAKVDPSTSPTHVVKPGNPGNHYGWTQGHHYGWFRHNQAQTPVTPPVTPPITPPVTPPITPPQTAPTPGTYPAGGEGGTSSTSATSATGATSQGSGGSISSNSSSFDNLPITVPVRVQPSSEVNVAGSPASNPLSWLQLLILLALLALWFLIFARAARKAAKPREESPA